jgi:hypothetical protein
MRVVITKPIKRASYDFIDLPSFTASEQQDRKRKRSPSGSFSRSASAASPQSLLSRSPSQQSYEANEFVLDEESPEEEPHSFNETRVRMDAQEPPVMDMKPSSSPIMQSALDDMDEIDPREASPDQYQEPSPPVACGEQLVWIMEHLAKTAPALPDAAFNDLVSLVCEDEMQPRQVPTYLLARDIKSVFRSEIRFCDWAASQRSFGQLDTIERRLQQAFLALEGHAMQKYLVKEKAALAQMFRYLHIGLRRWVVIHEIMKRKTTTGHALVLINVLFPAHLSPHTLAAERGMAEDVAKHRKALVRFAGGVQQYLESGPGRLPADCPGYKIIATQMSWASVHAVLLRYLSLVEQAMAKIESFLEPIPEELQGMGIKRSDSVMNRIARHLIATCKHGFDPLMREQDDAKNMRAQRKEERRQMKLQKRQSADDSVSMSQARNGASPEL